MKIKNINIFLVSLLAAFLMACSGDDMPDMNTGGGNSGNGMGTGGGSSSTNKAPDFTLTALSGSEISLSDYEDKVVVLFFFGNT